MIKRSKYKMNFKEYFQINKQKKKIMKINEFYISSIINLFIIYSPKKFFIFTIYFLMINILV